jgi:hypothetical protein
MEPVPVTAAGADGSRAIEIQRHDPSPCALRPSCRCRPGAGKLSAAQEAEILGKGPR